MQPLKVIERCSQNAGTTGDERHSQNPGTTDDDRCCQNPEAASKGEGKLNSHNPDEKDVSLTGQGKISRGSPRDHVKRSSEAPRSKKVVPKMEDKPSKRDTEQAAGLDNKRVYQATPLGGSSDKKGKPQKKDISGGSRKKVLTIILFYVSFCIVIR